MITAAHVETVLRSISGAYGNQRATTAVLAQGANEALRTAGDGLTKEGAAAFLATLSQESGSFRYLTEAGSQSYLRGKSYYPYLGRGFEQVTHKSNYAAFGAWCKKQGLVTDADTFVKNPTSLADIKWAWLGGIWYWQTNGLWKYGNRGDFLATQQGVNLGPGRIGSSLKPSGMDARTKWYKAWLKIGADLLPDSTSPNTPTPDPTPEVPAVPIKYAPRHGAALAKYARSKVGTSYGVGWCQKFTNECGQTGSVGDWDGDKAADAEDGWKKAMAHGKVVKAAAIKDWSKVPEGVYHYWTGGGSDHGHACVGGGGRKIVSTDMTDSGPRYGKIGLCDVASPARYWGVTYAGYAIIEGNGYTLTDPPREELNMTPDEFVAALAKNPKLAESLAKAVYNADIIPNLFTSNAANKNVSAFTAFDRTGKRIKALEPAPTPVPPVTPTV